MKKIFTLIASALVAVSASALDYKVRSAAVAEGTVLVDNDFAKITTANGDQTPTLMQDEDGNLTPAEYAGESFSYYLGVRVTDAPSASNPTGTQHVSDEGVTNVAIVVEAKQNVDVTLFYKIGASKSIDCYDQTTGEAVSITQTATNPGEDWLFCTGVYQLQAGHTYTVYARGGTVQMHGINTAEGTYVAPATSLYANASAKTIDGFSAMEYSDGAKILLTGNASKAFSNGSSITIEGKNYTSTKVSNGAANTFYAPEGKKVYSFTIYSYVNVDSENRTPYWAQVGDKTFTADDTEYIMHSYKNGAEPDVYTYTFPEGLSEVEFKNAGEQLCFVLEVNYNADAVAAVSAAGEAAPAKAVKAVKNGRLVIVNGNAEYSVSGAQLK